MILVIEFGYIIGVIFIATVALPLLPLIIEKLLPIDSKWYYLILEVAAYLTITIVVANVSYYTGLLLRKWFDVQLEYNFQYAAIGGFIIGFIVFVGLLIYVIGDD
jgi:hypothetical protein